MMAVAPKNVFNSLGEIANNCNFIDMRNLTHEFAQLYEREPQSAHWNETLRYRVWGVIHLSLLTGQTSHARSRQRTYQNRTLHEWRLLSE